MTDERRFRTAAPGTCDLGRVAIVGSGRAGLALGTALARSMAGSLTMICRAPGRRRRVQHWVARCQATGEVAATEHNRWQILGEVSEACRYADTVIFATADRDLNKAAQSWQAAGAARSGQVWLHLSGIADPAVLRVEGSVADLGSAHPLAALPDPLARADNSLGQPAMAESIAPFQGALFAIAGNEPAMGRAEALARRVGGEPVELDVERRAAYHAAAAVVANDMVALLAIGETMAQRAGLTPEQARRGLLHLAHSSLNALTATVLRSNASLSDGLTGAVGRGDAQTLAAHLNALSEVPDGWTAHAGLSRILLALVREADALPEDRAAAVDHILTNRRRQTR